jgi:hypothetical protein
MSRSSRSRACRRTTTAAWLAPPQRVELAGAAASGRAQGRPVHGGCPRRVRRQRVLEHLPGRSPPARPLRSDRDRMLVIESPTTAKKASAGPVHSKPSTPGRSQPASDQKCRFSAVAPALSAERDRPEVLERRRLALQLVRVEAGAGVSRRTASLVTIAGEMTTAQERFSSLLRLYLSPGLRALGFKGSAQSYHIPSCCCWILLGIQRSTFSDAADLRFTLNLTVADKHKWAEMSSRRSEWPDRPNPNRLYGPGIWQARIGRLLPDNGDKWWHITPDTEVGALVNEVLALVRDHALPRMKAMANDDCRDQGAAHGESRE